MSNKNKQISESITKAKDSLVIKTKEEVKSLLKRKEQIFYDLGESLNVIKSLTKHSEFTKFIEDEIDFSHNLANKYMRIASNYSREEAISLGVRKATALLSLDKKTRIKFMEKHDVASMKCDKLDELLKELKEPKKVDELAKATRFVKNIDKFKEDLSKKISVFVRYRYDIDDALIQENKAIFDKLEELNALITSVSKYTDTSNNPYGENNPYEEDDNIDHDLYNTGNDSNSGVNFDFDGLNEDDAFGGY